jgi:heme A synthase
MISLLLVVFLVGVLVLGPSLVFVRRKRGCVLMGTKARARHATKFAAQSKTGRSFCVNSVGHYLMVMITGHFGVVNRDAFAGAFSVTLGWNARTTASVDSSPQVIGRIRRCPGCGSKFE